MTNTSNRAPFLNALASAVRNSVKSRNAEIEAVKAAGLDQDDTRQIVMTTRVAMALDAKSTQAAMKEAAVILALPGPTSKQPHKQTEEQGKLAASARKYWSRLLSDAGVKSKGSNAGNVNASKPKAPAKTVPVAGQEIKVPQAVNSKEVHTALQGFAALMLAFANKSGTAMDVKSQNLIKKFASDAAALAKK